MADENDTDMPDEDDTLLWEGRTGDSEVPAMPGVGKWQTVEDPVNDLTYLEIEEYCTFRRLFMRYLEFVLAHVPIEHMLRVYDQRRTLDQEIRKFPSKNQLCGQLSIPDSEGLMRFVVKYHTSYLEFDNRNTYTRSAMLAQLPRVVLLLREYHPLFKQPFTGGRLEGCNTLYDWVLKSFDKWEGMAKASFKVPFGAVQARETHGRLSGSGAKLEELLLKLKMFTE